MKCHKKMKKFTYKRIVLVCGVLFLLSYVFLQIASAGELDDVKKAIEKKGANWTADDTSVSNLPNSEKKLRTGAILSDEAIKASPGKTLPVSGLPIRFDWRTSGMVTSVKNQGSCGSCWAFGTIAQLESVIEIYNNRPNQNIDLSEQYLVSCVDCTPSCPSGITCGGCNGCYVPNSYNFLVNIGTTDENSDPYQAVNGTCPGSSPPIVAKLSRWDPVTQSADQLKAAVSLHPITVAFDVYNDFYYYKGGVYEHVTGNLVGGHAVCIVGWDDNPPKYKGKAQKPCFIVKNSWGTNWGEGGFFKIAYTQVTNEVNFGRAAGNFALSGLLPAPPITANHAAAVTLWGSIKSSY